MKTIRTRDVNNLDLPSAVQSVLPRLAVEARDWIKKHPSRRMGTTFCPRCGGNKTKHAFRCAACSRAVQRERAAHGARPYGTASRTPDAMTHERFAAGGEDQDAHRLLSTRHVHRAGTVRTSPTRPRMVKQADGSWVEE